MLALKEQILEGLKPEGVQLTEKIELKKQIYEKFVGVDLWYAYVDPNGNIKVDILFKPTNNTGNLLNGPSSDTVIIEPDDLTPFDDETKGGGLGGGTNNNEIITGTSVGDIISSTGSGGTDTSSGKPTGPGVTSNGRIVGTISNTPPSTITQTSDNIPSSSNSSTSFGNILSNVTPFGKPENERGGY
jgi:hypothetical protein